MSQSRQKQSKTAKFLRQFAWCCFCGGSVPATTRDHVPSRAFFTKRVGPEDFEFPACEKCQRDARISDLVTAAISRVSPHMNSEALRDVAELYQGFRNNDRAAFIEFVGPERSSGLLLPAATRRRLCDANGWPLMNIGVRLLSHVESYVSKLSKALYFKHSGQILPSTATTTILTVSNSEIGSQLDQTLANVALPGIPIVARAKRSLTDQFDYRYVIADKGAAFKVRFHESFRFCVLVELDGNLSGLYISDHKNGGLKKLCPAEATNPT